MAVYTRVEHYELQPILDAAGLGRLQRIEGIPRGVENSNYYLDTVTAEGPRAFVLTIIERQPESALHYSWALMAALSDLGFPCPRPIHPRVGDPWPRIRGRPAVIVSRLPGEHVQRPTPAQCASVGGLLARLHGLEGLPEDDPGDQHGPDWRERTAAAVRPGLDPVGQELLDRALDLARELDGLPLPRRVIHADVFRDNTLFDGEAVTGLVDLHYAHPGPRLYDLAVAANDFCRADDDASLDPDRVASLLDAYSARHVFEAVEREAWRSMLAVAASRFWLSRLHDAHRPRPGAMPVIKDPEEFRRVLDRRLSEPTEPSGGLP